MDWDELEAATGQSGHAGRRLANPVGFRTRRSALRTLARETERVRSEIEAKKAHEAAAAAVFKTLSRSLHPPG